MFLAACRDAKGKMKEKNEQIFNHQGAIRFLCRNMSDAEIIATVLVLAIYFSGHHEKAMIFMESTGIHILTLEHS
jgi:hypothetical protein